MLSTTPTFRARLTTWNFAVVFATTLYSAGGAAVQSCVNYPSWRYVGLAEWPAFRASHEALLPVFVLPFFISFLFKVIFLFLRPPGVPRWGPWIVVALHLEVMVATVAVILPRFQVPLDHGPAPALIDQLVAYDIVLRGAPCLVTIGLMTYLAVRAIGYGHPVDAGISATADPSDESASP